MAGTTEGGLKAATKNKANDIDFYRRIGALGGRNGKTGGFYGNREAASWAGAKGGRISRRGHTYLYTKDGWHYYTNNTTGKTVKYEVQ